MKYEYGEPVEQSRYEPGSINQSDGMFFMWLSDDQRRHRIIACINACAGLSNEDLETMGLGGVAQMLDELADLKQNYAEFYWPLRRRQTPNADESPNPQNATLSDIAGLLQRILDRMPEREVE